MSLESQAEAIRQMQEMEGWQIVESYLVSKQALHIKNLLSCPLEEVMKNRHMIEAYKSIVVHLESIVKESQEVEAP